MPQILLYLIAVLGVLILLYYIFMIIAGKRFARLVQTKDRFIWNGLRNVSDRSMPYARKTNTLFLDKSNLIVSPDSIVRMSGQIRRTGTLAEALVVPFERIVRFDFDSSLKDSNFLFRFFAFLFNKFFKVNNYNLYLQFIDERDDLKDMQFRARNMDARDFELAFADFDNRIYSGRTLQAHEKRKKRGASVQRNEGDVTEPLAPAEFSLADEEVSVLEQTIYLPQEELDLSAPGEAPAAEEELDLPLPASSSEETVLIRPAAAEPEPPAQEPAPEEHFSLAEDDLEQTVAVNLESADTRSRMRAFMQKRK